jgi:glycine/D-amino acid oxidase-like deaminating enzyme
MKVVVIGAGLGGLAAALRLQGAATRSSSSRAASSPTGAPQEGWGSWR